MRIEKKSSLSYDDIGIVSDVISEINSRSDIEPLVEFCGHYVYPMIGSPMPDVCDGKMALELSRLKCYGFIHRFQSVKEQIKDYNHVVENGGYAGCAIPLNDWEERYTSLKKHGCNSFLIDCANGASRRVINVAKEIVGDCYLTVGNVHSSKMFNELSQLGVHAIRVGIAGGCFISGTKVKTKNGRKSIEKIKIGEDVLTHDSSYQKVVGVSSREEIETIIDVNGIKCTKNHEFYVVHKNDKDKVNKINLEKYAKWVSAEDLSEDFFLVKIKE